MSLGEETQEVAWKREPATGWRRGWWLIATRIRRNSESELRNRRSQVELGEWGNPTR